MKSHYTSQGKSSKISSFVNNYSSLVNHFLSKLHPNNDLTENNYVIYDPPLHETKVKRIKEDLVRCIWYGQHYNKSQLSTEDGSRLEVIYPGGWNYEDGPDFHHSEILFSKYGIKKGDVEVHVFSKDWNRHGHSLQDTYNNVSLHVIMWNDQKDAFVYNKNGSPIPQLVLSNYLDTGLDELFETINIKEFPKCVETNSGPCKKNLASSKSNRNKLGLLLDYAGDERIALKAKKFNKLLEEKTFEQTLYESIMEALGYKNNKSQFLTLATILQFNDLQKLVPIDTENSKKVIYIQAAFFGMAGLLPSQLQKKNENKPDQNSFNYINKLEEIWASEILPRADKTPMDDKSWNFSKSRPANFPTRRLAAMSQVVAKSLEHGGLFKLILAIFEKAKCYKDERKQLKVIVKGVESVLMENFDDYWSNYYTFNGKTLPRSERLIGKERTSDIFINILIPLLLINAKKSNNISLEKMVYKVFNMYPRTTANNITKFMTNRIFGNQKEANIIVTNARRQQGLHQIFSDFCDSDNFLCEKCVVYLMLRQCK